MAQVKKLSNGDKVKTKPKNLNEYEEEVRRVEEENRRKLIKSNSDQIEINGNPYSLKEARQKMVDWMGTTEAMDLYSSYGRKARNVEGVYNKFLDLLDKGKIKSIRFNPQKGFDITYNLDEGESALDLSDKYASDYLTRAIRASMLGLSTNTYNPSEAQKIDLGYNPESMLISEVWGREINPEVYGASTEAQRTQDVIRTLEANRDRYNEYFTNPEAFNLTDGDLPFKSMEEYDTFINNLKSFNDSLYLKNEDGTFKLDANGNRIINSDGSNWSKAEIWNDRRMGNFWYDYIFAGKGNNPPTVTRGGGDNIPTKVEESEEVKDIRKRLGIPDTEAGKDITIDNIIISPDGTLKKDGQEFSGYFDGRPYGLDSGWFANGKRTEATTNEEALNYIRNLNVTDPVRAAWEADFKRYRDDFNSMVEAGQRYTSNTGKYDILGQLNFAFPDLNLEQGKNYIIENKSDQIPVSQIFNGSPWSPDRYSLISLYDGDYNFLSPTPYMQSKGTFLIDNKTGEIQRVQVGWNTNTQEAQLQDLEGKTLAGFGTMSPVRQSSYLNPETKKPYESADIERLAEEAFQTVMKSWNNNMDELAKQLYGENYSKYNPEAVTNRLKELGYSESQINYMLDYLLTQLKYEQRYDKDNLWQNAILYNQSGGSFKNSSSLNTKKQADFEDILDWGNLSNQDKANVIGLAADTIGLAASFIPGVGNVVGAGAGVVGTISNAIGSGLDDEGYSGRDFGNTLLNLGLDAVGLIPGLGIFAKGTKLAKASKTTLKWIKRALIAAGGVSAGQAFERLASGEKLSVNDARLIVNGLTPLVIGGRRKIQREVFTTRGTPETKIGDYTVGTKTKTFTLKNLTEEDFDNFKSARGSKAKKNFIKEKLKNNTEFKESIEKDQTKWNTDEFKKALDDELSTIILPGSRWSAKPKNWVNPHRMSSTTIKGERVLNDNAIEGLSSGRYGWYRRSAIDEIASELDYPSKLGKWNQGEELYAGIHRDKDGKLITSIVQPKVSFDDNTPTIQRMFGRMNTNIERNLSTRPSSDFEISRFNSIMNPNKKVKDQPKFGESGNEDYSKSFKEYLDFILPKSKRRFEYNSKQYKKLQDYWKSLNPNTDDVTAIVITSNPATSNINTALVKKLRNNAIRRRNLEDARAARSAKAEETKLKLAESRRKYKEELRKREYKELTDYNKQQREAAEKALKKANAAETKKKEDRVKRKESRLPKKTSKDRGDRVTRRFEGGIIKLATGDKILGFKGNYFKSNPIKSSIDYTFNPIINPFIGSTLYSEAPYYSLSSIFNNKGEYESTLFNDYMAEQAFKSQAKTKIPLHTNPTEEFAQSSQFDQKERLGGLPLTTLSSIYSYISKNAANNRIYNTLKKGLKPVIYDTPQQINYNIQGNEGLRSAYYNQAADLMNLGSKNLTSDADRQLAYNLELAKKAAELRITGDQANEQALNYSRDKAFQVNAENLRQREQVAAQNRANIIGMKNQKVQLDATRQQQNAHNLDVFLHDITEQIKQRSAEKQAIQTRNKLLDTQASNYEQTISDNIEANQIATALQDPNLTAETKATLINKLKEIRSRQLMKDLKEAKFTNTSSLRRVW